MSNEAPYQVNLKTPKGSLLNLRAWDEQQLDTVLDGLEVRMQRILQLEDTIDELHKLSSNPAAQAIQNLQNAGFNPVPVTPAPMPAAVPSAAPAGSPVCDHGLPMRFVAAGISKAGKPYKAFYACPNARESACNKKVAA
ncbi:MAG: hypothetical protein EBZ61_11565 [Micrococcales bacterium]|jgi:hypothetical protein|nr:hypothetical protein [Micrococcales bacterium]